MKKLILSMVLLASVTLQLTQAQNSANQGAPQKMTLEECIEYALSNSPTVKQAAIDSKIADAQVNQIKAQGLPQVNGNINFTDNVKLQTQFLPAIFFAEDPINNPPPVDAPPVGVQFGTRYSSNISASVDQLLFDGTFFLGLKAAKTFKELSVKAEDQSKVDVVANVSKAYYSVLVNKEQLNLLEQNYDRLDTLLSQTKIMYENGFAEQIDVNRIEVAYNNTKTEKNKLLQLLELSKKLLKYQMSMDLRTPLELAANLDDLEFKQTNILQDDIFDYTNRVEYNVLKTQLELDQLNIRRYQVGYYPSVYAFGSYGINSGANKIGDLEWFSFGAIGLRVNIPIFDGFLKKYQIQEARFAAEKTELNIQNLELSIDFEQNQAKVNLLNAIEDLEIQQRNLELAEEVIRVTKIKFQEGIGSTLEVVDAETSYKESETNYYGALYNAVTSKVDYEKAIGTLYNQE